MNSLLHQLMARLPKASYRETRDRVAMKDNENWLCSHPGNQIFNAWSWIQHITCPCDARPTKFSFNYHLIFSIEGAINHIWTRKTSLELIEWQNQVGLRHHHLEMGLDWKDWSRTKSKNFQMGIPKAAWNLISFCENCSFYFVGTLPHNRVSQHSTCTKWFRGSILCHFIWMDWTLYKQRPSIQRTKKKYWTLYHFKGTNHPFGATGWSTVSR